MKTQGSLLLIALFFAACYVSAQDVVVTQEIAAGSESGVSSENAVIVASVGNSLVWRDDRGEDITYFTNGSDFTTKVTTNITSQTAKQVYVNHLPSGYYFVRMKGSNSVVRLLKVGY